MELNHRFIQAAILLSLLNLSACATFQMTPGENMDAQAELIASLSKHWKKGKKIAKKGESLLEKGQERLERGRAEMKEGDFLIQAGSAAVEKNRVLYQQKSTKAGLSRTPGQIETEIDSLKQIAKRWQAGLEKIQDGNALISTGAKRVQKGQAEIEEGHRLTSKGSQLMQRSESMMQKNSNSQKS